MVVFIYLLLQLSKEGQEFNDVFSLIFQQKLVAHPLCTRHYFRCFRWLHGKKPDKIPVLVELTFSCENKRTTSVKFIKQYIVFISCGSLDGYPSG